MDALGGGGTELSDDLLLPGVQNCYVALGAYISSLVFILQYVAKYNVTGMGRSIEMAVADILGTGVCQEAKKS